MSAPDRAGGAAPPSAASAAIALTRFTVAMRGLPAALRFPGVEAAAAGAASEGAAGSLFSWPSLLTNANLDGVGKGRGKVQRRWRRWGGRGALGMGRKGSQPWMEVHFDPHNQISNLGEHDITLWHDIAQ